MKLVKIFGIVMGFHAAAFMFIFAIPGCRSTNKKPVATAPVVAAESSPIAPVEPAASSPAASSEVSAVRFSPTRPGTPAAAELVAPPAPTTYVVVKGDNLWSIAKKTGVTVKQLTAANKISTDTPLKLGQKLTIPVAKTTPAVTAPTASVAPAAAPVAAKTSTVHVVKSGETLGVIAKKYQVKVGDIATANNIADPTKIRVGQSLKIPGVQAPAAKNATPAPAVAPAPAPAVEPAPVAPAPVSPLFGSPIESAPAPDASSPFITPAPESEAPVIRVEESGAPKIE